MPKMPKIKRRMKPNKKFAFAETKDSEQMKSYKKGATLGALMGVTAGLLWGQKIILCTVIGTVIGGYMSYEFYKDDYKVKSFKDFIKDDSIKS